MNKPRQMRGFYFLRYFMKKICKTCKNELLESFYTEQSGDSCIFCESKNIKSDPIAKKGGYEIVDDKGCVGGGCTL